MRMLSHRCILGTAALLAALFALPAFAQNFPSRTVTIVVGYAPGGTGDFISRMVANKLGPMLGQSVVAENRAGASGAIALQGEAAATPHGPTLPARPPPEVPSNPPRPGRVPTHTDRAA